MKIYEKRETTSTYLECVRRTCDLCGKESSDGDWEKSTYEQNETNIEIKIKHREGYNVSDGGSGDEIEIDLCPDCFRHKLVPWLQSEGAKINYSNWSW